MTDAKRDNNMVTTLLAVSNVDGKTPVTVYADPITHRLLVDLPVSGSSLTVGSTTISGGVNGRILYDNNGVLGEMATTGNGTVSVLQTSPTLVTPNIGIATAAEVIYTNNAMMAVGNAVTVPITSRLTTVQNNSASPLGITIATAGAVDGQFLTLRILDFAVSGQQLISWTNIENGKTSVPSLTAGSSTLFLTVGFIFNGLTGNWRCVLNT